MSCHRWEARSRERKRNGERRVGKDGGEGQEKRNSSEYPIKSSSSC
jgi:hypothetical protein